MFYDVEVRYTGCYKLEIEAESEDEATDKAYAEFAGSDDKEIVSNIDDLEVDVFPPEGGLQRTWMEINERR